MLKLSITAAVAAVFGLAPAAMAQVGGAPTRIQLGRTVQGVLTDTDGLLAPDRRHDCYRLDAPKGQAFEVAAVSTDFAAAVLVTQEDGCRYPGEGAVVDEDGTGARHAWDGQGWGLYLAITGRRPGELGAYRLEVKPVGERRTGEAILFDMVDLHSRIYAEEQIPVRPFGNSATRIERYGTAEWQVEVPADARYSILAVCDENCDDVDMAVLDVSGREISADREAADFARVGFGAASGQATTVTIRLEMIECANAEGCLAGAVIYQLTD